MSLSPRPERLRMARSVPAIFGMRSSKPAMACADSSAGMIPSVRESRRAGAEPAAACAVLDADKLHIRITQELVKQSNGIRAAADTGKKMRRQTFFRGKDLLPRLAADHRLKIANHGRIRMRAKNGPEQIMGGPHVGDPVAHGLVDGVLQRAAAGIHGHDLGAEHAHTRDVQRLARHVLRAHVYDALEA